MCHSLWLIGFWRTFIGTFVHSFIQDSFFCRVVIFDGPGFIFESDTFDILAGTSSVSYSVFILRLSFYFSFGFFLFHNFCPFRWRFLFVGKIFRADIIIQAFTAFRILKQEVNRNRSSHMTHAVWFMLKKWETYPSGAYLLAETDEHFINFTPSVFRKPAFQLLSSIFRVLWLLK